MRKYFKLFLVFILIFGLIGGVFGGNSNNLYSGVVKFNYWGPDSSYNILFDNQGNFKGASQNGVKKTFNFLQEYNSYTGSTFSSSQNTVFDIATKISKTANSNYLDKSFVNLNGVVYNKKNAVSINPNLVKKNFYDFNQLPNSNGVIPSKNSIKKNPSPPLSTDAQKLGTTPIPKKLIPSPEKVKSSKTTTKTAQGPSIETCRTSSGKNCLSENFFDSGGVYKFEKVQGVPGISTKVYLDDKGKSITTTNVDSFKNLVENIKLNPKAVLNLNADLKTKTAFSLARNQPLTNDQIGFMKKKDPGIKLLALNNQEIRNSIDTTNLNLDQKKIVLGSSYSDLSTKILSDAKDTDIGKLCSGDLNSKCINTMVGNGKLRARLPTLIDSNSILVDSNTVSSILSDPTISQDTKDKIQSAFLKKDCIGSINPFCKFTSKINQRDAYISSLNSKIEIAKLNNLDVGSKDKSIKINGQKINCKNTKCYKAIIDNCNGDKTCIEKGVSQLKQKAKTLDYKKTNNIVFDAYLEQSGLTKNKAIKKACEINLDSVCESAIKNACKNNAKGNCGDILAGFSQLKDSKLVQTNAIFDVINALANPDQNALNAAKLFGFEPNYNNVPKMLRTSVSSQICAAKIGGYLDKTETNSGGGVTSYGCDSAQSYNYDPNTGHSVNIEPNCRKVLLDFRAQRAQITPDNKVAITYSMYLKAPAKTNINYFIAVKYLLKDKSTKKQLLIVDKNLSHTGVGGIAKEYSTIFLPLNVSRSLIDDSKSSFHLAILARYPGGNYYQFQSIPVVLMTASDSYSGISAGNGAGAGSSSGTGSSNAALTPAGLLSLIH